MEKKNKLRIKLVKNKLIIIKSPFTKYYKKKEKITGQTDLKLKLICLKKKKTVCIREKMIQSLSINGAVSNTLCKLKNTMHTMHCICYKNAPTWHSPHIASEQLVLSPSNKNHALLVKLFYRPSACNFKEIMVIK